MSVGDIQIIEEERPSYVRFEVREVKDGPASLAAGHYVAKDEEWALISALGSSDIVPKKAEKWFEIVKTNVARGREPAKHLEMYQEIYDRWKKGLEPPVDGTSVKNWNALSPAQCANLISVGLRTIEDVAQAPDDSMRRYGMGIQDLKNKAKAWLQAANPLAEEVTQLKNQNAQLQGTIDSLQDQIKRFEIRMDAQDGEYKPMEHSAQAMTRKINPPLSNDIQNGEFGKPILNGVGVPLPEEVKTISQRYEEKFGRPPHHRMKDSTILKALQE